ncbi:MAG: ABC transporter ATP-binding protein [Polyangiaceae bacterium]
MAGEIRDALDLARRFAQLLPRKLALGVGLVVSASIYGAAHAAVAVCAGVLGKSLVVAKEPGFLLDVLWIGLGASAVKAGSGVFLAYSQIYASRTAGNALRVASARRLLQSGSSTGAPDTGATLAVSVRAFENSVEGGLLAGLRAVAQLVPLALGLIFVSASLAAGGMVVLAVFATALSYARRHLRRAHVAAQRTAQAVHAGADEVVSHLDLLRTYGAGDRALTTLENMGRHATRAEARAESVRAAISGSNEVLGALGLALVIALLSRSGAFVTDGTIVAFAAVFFMAYRPLRELSDARSHCMRGSVALSELESLPQHDASTHAGIETEVQAPTHLRLQDFGARRGGPRISVQVSRGQMLGLSGPTGAGKTTMLRALLGLEPALGQLWLDDRDICQAPVGPASRPFAWVPQDAPLLTATLTDNVVLFGGQASAVPTALRSIGAGQLSTLGDTLVGPGGRSLSGGERRLVSLARAVVSGLGVVLLDEPTEGLDAESEQAVHRALVELKREHVVVVVSHRPGTLALCDQVLELSAGVMTGENPLAAE